MHVVRVSGIYETDAVDAPAGSPAFLNAVVSGYTSTAPDALLDALLALEQRLGRRRRGIRNEPRVIDVDLILYSGNRLRTPHLTVPHPRAHQRAFVRVPMAEVGWAPWD